MFSVPARWPAWRERPRARAQRPLPSMMIATCRGSGSMCGSASSWGAGAWRSPVCGATVAWEVRATPDLHQLGFLVLAGLVHVRDVLVGQLLELVRGPPHLVFGHLMALLQLAQLIMAVAADVPNGDAPFLHTLVHELGQLLAPLLVDLRQRQPDHVTVVGRRNTQVGLLDRLLDHAERATVPGLDRQQARLRHGYGGELIDRHRRAVVVDADVVDETD